MKGALAVLAGALAVAVLAAVPLPPPEASLPPLPDSIPSALGWVRVHYVAGLTCGGGEEVLGCFEPLRRQLSVRDSMDLAVAWQTLRHEELHMIAFDAGIHIVTRGQEDMLADAVGAQRVREMRVK